MSRQKAPDNMPTDVIQIFIDGQEVALNEAVHGEEVALRKLKEAIHAQRRASDLLGEYNGWMYYRLQEESDA